jgi:hypothetical protein
MHICIEYCTNAASDGTEITATAVVMWRHFSIQCEFSGTWTVDCIDNEQFSILASSSFKGKPGNIVTLPTGHL